ncbi:MAG TPA: ABC transporter ATP-binding protein [Methylibium sp.]|nr:ABC transporter ATP-binding protein [Methylibium sp.]
MGEPMLLQAEAVSLSRGGRRVVDGVSVALRPAEWVAVVGPNGAGKSSLLSLLAGLRAADAGQVRLHGRPIAAWRPAERARQIAWLAQQGEAEGAIAARDVVRLGRLPHHGVLGACGAADEAAVDAAMAETACAAFASRRLSELSGGERQRVLLARALAVQAPVLLLDEPTTHLDAPHQRDLLRSVARGARAGAAAAVVLHDLTLALAADRVWLMDQGRLVADAPPDDPSLHAALARVFGDAVAIERLEREGRVHHLVRPRL